MSEVPEVRVIAWLAAAAMATAGVLEATTQAAAWRPHCKGGARGRRGIRRRSPADGRAADLRGRGMSGGRVLAAMGQIGREAIACRPTAGPRPTATPAVWKIGHGEETISRPFIVALMTELVRTSPRSGRK